jgi:hypothetical protein
MRYLYEEIAGAFFFGVEAGSCYRDQCEVSSNVLVKHKRLIVFYRIDLH